MSLPTGDPERARAARSTAARQHAKLGIAIATCAALGALLSACASPAFSFESQLVQNAETGEPFTLPQAGTPSGSWDRVVVLCPYAGTSQLPSEFAEAAAAIDTQSTESTQWLLFRARAGVETLTLSRDRVDLCSAGSTIPLLGGVADQWEAQREGTAWSIRLRSGAAGAPAGD
ncbi:hypothetical protein [Leucobacter iarius]|uniref:Lipoprotein n=1 Tax=Leucobacter iarius TaxID=333963 RepID=A0ABN2LSL7_9MICO